MSDEPIQAEAKNDADPGRKYRLNAQSEVRRGEGANIPLPDGFSQLGLEQPEARGRLATWWIAVRGELVLAILTVGFFILAALLVAQGSSLSSRAQLILIALIPLTGVAALLAWLDRWAPVGVRYKLYAVAWGGGVAALASMLVNTALFSDLLLYRGDEARATLIASVVVAPIGEELFKGLGVVLILFLARHQLTSALSAVALAGLVGAGFAYVENLEYFWQSWLEGSTVFGFTVFARAIMSPFVHPMATSFTGLAVGGALIRRATPWGWTWRLLLGYASAVGVHALWNGLASVGAMWIVWYFVVEIPLFIAWLVALIVWSRRLSRSVARGLVPYTETGWISPAEAQVVLNPRARKTARRWARKLKAPAPKLLRKFQRDLGRLGMDQELMTVYGPQDQRIILDRKYLYDALAVRDELAALELVRTAGAAK